MKINYNVSAMLANNTLNKNDKALNSSIEKLSSGLKINRAKDNASGLAMAKRMNAQIRSLEISNQNANDGISVVQIAEGALQEIEDMVQRMNELAVKAGTATMTDDDRKAIDEEIKQLKDEVSRVAETTMYNGGVLLDGSYDVKAYTDDARVKVATYGDGVKTGDNYLIEGLSVTITDNKITSASCTTLPDGATDFDFDSDSIYITGPNGYSFTLYATESISGEDVTINATGLGAMGLQIGTNEGQMLDVRIAAMNLRNMGLENVNCSTQENAEEFIEKTKKTLTYINEARSRLGAYENRLEHTIKTLDISSENMTSAYSRIMDVDMAEEMTSYTTSQVLVQAGTSMLAQANERPSQVLQLLQ